MKTRTKINMLMLILLGGGGSLAAQVMSVRSNDIALNYTRPALTRGALPTIRWISPKLEFTSSEKNSIEIETVIACEDMMKSITLTVGDGTATRGKKSIDVDNGRGITLKQPVTLLNGNNVVRIEVETVNGLVISSERIVLVGKDAISEAISVDRKDYALIFATDHYDNWSDLVNPIDDATSIAKLLEEKYGFRTEIVKDPTIDEVFGKLHEYATRKFKPQDQLMIFFAGHGYFDETFGEGFVVAKNSLENDKAKTSYISHNRLRGIIQNIPSEHILLAMDVCFGGTFDPVVAKSRGEAFVEEDSNFLTKKLSTRTRKYITSGGKEYVSDGIAGKHSPFTQKLLTGLTEGAKTDRVMSLSRLKVFVEKLQPEPRMGSFGDDGSGSDFVFVRK